MKAFGKLFVTSVAAGAAALIPVVAMAPTLPVTASLAAPAAPLVTQLDESAALVTAQRVSPPSTPATAPQVTQSVRHSLVLDSGPTPMLSQFSGPYGGELIPGCSWATWVPNCSNLTVYGNGSSFGDTGCGPPNGCTFGPEFQCTELAQRYAHYAFGEPDTWWAYGAGAAYSFWDAGPKLPVPLQQFPNGGGVLPQQGDIIVFAPGWIGSYWDPDGHVAVVTGVDVAAGYVSIVEENGSSTGANRLNLSGTSVSHVGYTPTLGWLRDTGASHAQRLVAGGVAGRPQAVSLSPGQSEIAWRGADNRLGIALDDGGHVARLWPAYLPANMASDPAVVALPNGGVEVFWRSDANELWMAASFTRYHAQDLGVGGLGSAPHAAVSGGGVVAVTWTAGGGLWSMELAGAAARTRPAPTGDSALNHDAYPVFVDSATLAVFWRGADGNLWWDEEAGAAWRGAESLGNGPLASDPQPVATTPGSLAVVWLGVDSRAYQVSFSAGAWAGAGAVSDPGVTQTPYPAMNGSGVLSVFLDGAAANLAVATYFPDSGWLGPAQLGDGPMASAPTAALDSTPGTLDVFWQGADGGLWTDSAW